MNVFVAVSVGVLRGWHRWISPAMPGACRYLPTCSEYGASALELHGFWKGWALTLLRLARCHPWGGHGWDPVPESSKE